MNKPDDDAQIPRRKRMTTHPPRVSTTTPGVIVRTPGESGPIRSTEIPQPDPEDTPS
jgi:hypothetical protein